MQATGRLGISGERDNQLDVSKLIARTAHDIRSPIAAIEMGLHMIEGNISKKELMIFKMALRRIHDIANNLLDGYRGEYAPNSVLIKSILEEVILLKHYEWHDRDYELIFSPASDNEYLRVNAVSDDINRILSNLLNNAIEACKYHAKIDICINKLDKFIELAITDNGVGMPAKKIRKYLNGESTKHSGMGLGLSSAKRYIEKIGGRLLVESQLGVGTTVILRFIAT